MRLLSTFLFIVFFNSLTAQNTVGVGYELSFLNTAQLKYNYNLAVFNENETVDYYHVINQVGILAHGFTIRSYGKQFHAQKKMTVGYSLELGYRFFQSKSKSSLTYMRNPINYNVVYFNHYLDWHWNLSESIKFTNSFGVGIAAITKGISKSLGHKAAVINNDHPIIKFVYQPQITERYEHFSVTYFCGIDVVSFSFLKNKYMHDYGKIPFKKLRFNTIGLRFVFQPKTKSKPITEY